MREHRGIALAVAGLVVTCFAILPGVLVVLIYLFVSGYAIAKAIGAGGPHPNPATILVGVVAIVGTLVTLLGVGIALLGRAMDAKKRREAEIPGL